MQLPLSSVDQCLFLDETIKVLHENGLSIYARSLYLQGIILTSQRDWPAWTSPLVKAHQRNFESFSVKSRDPLSDLALQYLKSLPYVNSIVVGIYNFQQYLELCKSWQIEDDYLFRKLDWQPLALDDIYLFYLILVHGQ